MYHKSAFAKTIIFVTCIKDESKPVTFISLSRLGLSLIPIIVAI